MKLFSRMGVTLLIALSFVYMMPQVASAQEISEFVDDHAAVGTAETGLSSSGSSRMTEDQQRQYNQTVSGESFDLEVGESMVIGSDADGIISITCVRSSAEPVRASMKTSYKSYNIAKTILGVNTTLASVDLECTWYANGVDGYISNLRGTYTEKK